MLLSSVSPTRNSYPLPENMKRPEVRPVPPRPSRLAILPSWCTWACYMFWLACVLVFEPYPEISGHEWAGMLMGPLFVLGILCFGLGLILSGIALISGYERARNTLVLVLCLVAPLASLGMLVLVN